MSYKVSGKDWADIFFKLDPSDVSKSKYMCILCPVGSQLYTSAKGHGYTNLKTHITVKHSESITDMVNEFRGIKNNNTLDNYSNKTGRRVTFDGTKYFNWLRYCVFLDHPLSAADDDLLTEVTGLQKTTSKSLKKYFFRVGHLTALKVREILPDEFGILFDGWTSNHSKEHYVILVALFMKDGTLHTPLLACSPMDTLGEFGAVAHYDFITTTLRFYHRTCEDLQFATVKKLSLESVIEDLYRSVTT